MQPAVPAPPSPADAATAAAGWRSRVEDATNRAATAIARGDLRGLDAIFGELDDWDDLQRAYQARCRLCELALAFTPAQAAAWPPVFATTAGGVLDALEREPREPLLLNYAGVLLYELTATAGAESLFRAAIRLDPDLPHVTENLEAARTRGGARPPVRGAAAASLRALAKRAKRIADRARPASGMTLSLVMIVKDEQEMLPGCLEAVKDAVDEMIIVDTGSSDRTVEIARSFGATVVDFPWNGSFADARNVSIDNATCDWVMYLDADEHMIPEDAPKLRELLSRTWREAFYLVETNYTGGDESGAAVTHHALRLWRRRPQYRFEGRIHEQKTHTMPTYLPQRFETSTVRMRHYGYLRSRITAKDKSRRNIELLELEARENPSPFNQYNLEPAFHLDRPPERSITGTTVVVVTGSRRMREQVEQGLVMNVQSVTLKAVAGALGDAARTLALEPGAELVARVVAAPADGGRGTISLAGALLQAQLPADVEAGQTLKLTVVRLDQTQLLVRIQHRSGTEQTATPALSPAAGQLAVSGEGELLRAALALAGQEPLWLPDGGAADVRVQADGGSSGGGRGAAGEAAFVLHSPELGAIEVRLRMADGGVRAGVVTAPGEATALAEGALPDLVERLGQATGRSAAAAVSQRPVGRRPPAPPAGRVDVQA